MLGILFPLNMQTSWTFGSKTKLVLSERSRYESIEYNHMNIEILQGT